MSFETTSGNETLSEEDYKLIQEQDDALVAELEKAASASTEAKAWLNTSLGKAVRKTIIMNKRAAQEMAVLRTTDQSELATAQFDYEVWGSVEHIFANIITQGVEALNDLETRGNANAT